jgi:uncharacterized protein YndB with AHSA1/START domain
MTSGTPQHARERSTMTLEWHIDAPRDDVFRAWTDPAELGWFFNPEQPLPDEPIELDLRVGGVWRQVMVQDPATRYVTGGIYLEIDPPERLVFAFGAVGGWPEIHPERLDEAPIATVLLADADGGTDLTLEFSVPGGLDTAEAAETFGAMREGWRMTVDRLAAAVAATR